jgi:hypothetical protein
MIIINKDVLILTSFKPYYCALNLEREVSLQLQLDEMKSDNHGNLNQERREFSGAFVIIDDSSFDCP